MAVLYTLKWDKTFGYGMGILISEQLIKCLCILSTWKRASIREFSSKISPAKKLLRRDHSYTHQFQFDFEQTKSWWWISLRSSWTQFLFTQLRDVFNLSQTPHKKWSFPLRISSVNVTKSAVSGGSGHINRRNP